MDKEEIWSFLRRYDPEVAALEESSSDSDSEQEPMPDDVQTTPEHGQDNSPNEESPEPDPSTCTQEQNQQNIPAANQNGANAENLEDPRLGSFQQTSYPASNHMGASAGNIWPLMPGCFLQTQYLASTPRNEQAVGHIQRSLQSGHSGTMSHEEMWSFLRRYDPEVAALEESSDSDNEQEPMPDDVGTPQVNEQGIDRIQGSPEPGSSTSTQEQLQQNLPASIHNVANAENLQTSRPVNCQPAHYPASNHIAENLDQLMVGNIQTTPRNEQAVDHIQRSLQSGHSGTMSHEEMWSFLRRYDPEVAALEESSDSENEQEPMPDDVGTPEVNEQGNDRIQGSPEPGSSTSTQEQLQQNLPASIHNVANAENLQTSMPVNFLPAHYPASNHIAENLDQLMVGNIQTTPRNGQAFNGIGRSGRTSYMSDDELWSFLQRYDPEAAALEESDSGSEEEQMRDDVRTTSYHGQDNDHSDESPEPGPSTSMQEEIQQNHPASNPNGTNARNLVPPGPGSIQTVPINHMILQQIYPASNHDRANAGNLEPSLPVGVWHSSFLSGIQQFIERHYPASSHNGANSGNRDRPMLGNIRTTPGNGQGIDQIQRSLQSGSPSFMTDEDIWYYAQRNDPEAVLEETDSEEESESSPRYSIEE